MNFHMEDIMKKYKNYTRNDVYLPLETCTGNVKYMQSIEK